MSDSKPVFKGQKSYSKGKSFSRCCLDKTKASWELKSVGFLILNKIKLLHETYRVLFNQDLRAANKI